MLSYENNEFDVFLGLSTSSIPPVTTSQGASTYSTSTSATPTSVGGTLCSDPNGLYAHPVDCQKYYQCAHGTPYEYTCPSGLLWNDNVKTCDWPANVNCNPGIEK